MSSNPPPGSNHQPESAHLAPPGPLPEILEKEFAQSETSVIARDLVQLYLRAFGRGPNRARAFVQSQFAVCILRDVFTTAERTLLADGGEAEVEAARRRINDSIEEECIEIVETATKRSVQSHLAQVRAPADLVVHLFLFDENS
jgi:uncharacterized protein YbcI